LKREKEAGSGIPRRSRVARAPRSLRSTSKTINYLESESRGVELFSRSRNENSRHARAHNRDRVFAIAKNFADGKKEIRRSTHTPSE
jgi:hypothetical protein